MRKIVYETKIRPLGFCSILFLTLFFLPLLCIIVPSIQKDCNIIEIIKEFPFAFLVGLIFLLPILGQKIVVQNKKMSVYLWGRKKWTFDLTVKQEAELGFYYQDKFDKLLHRDRKYFSIQVKKEKQKVSFPVDLYSTKQIRTILFILNNSANSKFKDSRLNGQERYLINAHLIQSNCQEESSKQKHCEFCMKEIVFKSEYEKWYATKDRKYWICEKCFEDFKDMFNFRLLKKK
ncbi:MAG: hypothetical protein J6T84_04560 [Spirochaetaceae bacterium]|nr:hypothetical protein [Spirochaetaceae bacterium]